MSQGNKTDRPHWYRAIGRSGRVALILTTVFATIWIASMYARVIVRTSERSDFSLTNGAIFVKSYEWPGISTSPRFKFSKTLGRVAWRYKTGIPSSELFPIIPSYRYYEIPLWPVVFIPLTVFIIRFARRPRWIPGHCTGCTYNLEGNESGVCPEWGEQLNISE